MHADSQTIFHTTTATLREWDGYKTKTTRPPFKPTKWQPEVGWGHGYVWWTWLCMVDMAMYGWHSYVCTHISKVTSWTKRKSLGKPTYFKNLKPFWVSFLALFSKRLKVLPCNAWLAQTAEHYICTCNSCMNLYTILWVLDSCKPCTLSCMCMY